jgi:ABC-type transporter Mla maintaining outer membrane lipid asymmetry permease subunit MlaE
VFCLTLIFVAWSFLSVYVGGQWIGAKTGTFWDFTRDTLGALAPADVANLLLKCTLPALLTGCICCAEGLGAGDTNADVPRACRVAVQRSVMALFAVSAAVSVVAYL